MSSACDFGLKKIWHSENHSDNCVIIVPGAFTEDKPELDLNYIANALDAAGVRGSMYYYKWHSSSITELRRELFRDLINAIASQATSHQILMLILKLRRPRALQVWNRIKLAAEQEAKTVFPDCLEQELVDSAAHNIAFVVHSTGALLLHEYLHSSASVQMERRSVSAVILGGALCSNQEWDTHSLNKLYNVYSKKDKVLRRSWRLAEAARFRFNKPMGLVPIDEACFEGVHNINLTREIGANHSAYWRKFESIEFAW